MVLIGINPYTGESSVDNSVFPDWEFFTVLPRKEVIHPQLPLRMPCYDFVPIIDPTLASCYQDTSGVTDSLDVTGGEYKTRERIQRAVADTRLLAIPTS